MDGIGKKVKEIHALRETRYSEKSGNDFILSVLYNNIKNIGVRSEFFHNYLDLHKSDNSNGELSIASGLYICSLITCWETFFREIYIFICDTDDEVKQRLRIKYKDPIPLNLSLGEYSAKKYNFQNLESTKKSFDFIFKRESTALTEYFENYLLEGYISGNQTMIFRWLSDGILKEKIDSILENSFLMRHKVTHDANYLVEFDPELFFEIECVFHIVPQLIASNLAKKYGQKHFVINRKTTCIRMTDSPSEDDICYILSLDDTRPKVYYTEE